MKLHIRIRRILMFLSLLLFPLTLNYFSPYVIVDGAIQGYITASALVFAGQFILALFFGRAFCSHICPAGASLDLLDTAAGLKTAPRGASRLMKYGIWLPWITLIVIFYIQNADSLRLQLLHLTESGISVDEPLKFINYFMVLLILLIPGFIYGKRGACHTICWMAPFMIAGRFISNKLHIPALRLKSRKSDCTQCEKCSKACPMSLYVMDMVQNGKFEHRDCILCGECRNTCPSSVISYTFGGPGKSIEK